MYLNHKLYQKIQFFKILFVTLFSENISFSLYCQSLTVIAGRIVRLCKTCGSVTSKSCSTWYIKDFLKSLAYWSSLHYKYGLHGVMKKCFILLNYFVVVKDIELFSSTSLLLCLPLILGYLRISFPIFLL